jgi:chromate reductase, NAD(P)H dehydrogenase (quinone)
MQVLTICGSLQEQSSNRRLLDQAQVLAPIPMHITHYRELHLLPHFNLDLERDSPLPVVGQLRAAVAGSSALLIACPEYGHSLPGALKNAIDWLIGSGELEGKRIATFAVTAAPERGLLGLQALAQTLAAVKADLLGNRPIVKGNEAADLRALLHALAAAHVASQ